MCSKLPGARHIHKDSLEGQVSSRQLWVGQDTYPYVYTWPLLVGLCLSWLVFVFVFVLAWACACVLAPTPSFIELVVLLSLRSIKVSAVPLLVVAVYVVVLMYSWYFSRVITFRKEAGTCTYVCNWAGWVLSLTIPLNCSNSHRRNAFRKGIYIRYIGYGTRLSETRDNAIVDGPDYQIPVTRLKAVRDCTPSNSADYCSFLSSVCEISLTRHMKHRWRLVNSRFALWYISFPLAFYWVCWLWYPLLVK